jgi:hypothetical protein
VADELLQLANWPKFDLIVRADYWTIREAVSYLAVHYLADKKLKTNDEVMQEGKIAYSHVYSIVVDSIKASELAVNIGVYYEFFDESKWPFDGINIEDSKIKPINFVLWAIGKRLPMPEEFKEILPYYNMSITNIDHKEVFDATCEQEEMEGFCENEVTGSKYPVYSDLNFVGLPKDKFNALKRHYGMVRDEESKWRRAVAIAAKIGILFYERSLNIPTTKAAFLAAYKKEFDAILQNDSLAKHIYRNLPDNYQGVTKAPESRLDIDPIIKAAVLAGAQSGDRDSMNIKTLKKSLSVESYEIPSEDILEKIIVAVMKLDVEENE